MIIELIFCGFSKMHELIELYRPRRLMSLIQINLFQYTRACGAGARRKARIKSDPNQNRIA
ncbi:MAG: hypothetical protein WD823_04170 [Sulfuricaulis sp.]|uniref:hypothetical protein n=1 Tax=Sulfuricaulis sp. TaxID=2003553 RepID=UPI0034A3B069